MNALLIIKNRLVKMLAESEQAINIRMMSWQTRANGLKNQIEISCHVEMPENADKTAEIEINRNNKDRKPVREKAQSELNELEDKMMAMHLRQSHMEATVTAVQELIDELLTMDESQMNEIVDLQRNENGILPIHEPLRHLLSD